MKKETKKYSLIVYAHPYNGSFVHAELEMVLKGLKARGKKYHLIDLYKDKFDPVFYAPELKNYPKGVSEVPLVQKYQKMFAESDEVVFLYPI
jgi:putative NADPH-quinone reductase